MNRFALTAWLIGTVAGCTSETVDKKAVESPGVVDNDNDGSPYGEDCDDNDAARFPENIEVCNGIDDDCDESIDDDDDSLDATSAGQFFADFDNDGFGDPATGTLACSAPAGAVEDGTDCDDTRSDIHPGAQEICDAEQSDEDCSGFADNEDPNVDPSTQVSAWVDADGDGFGDVEGPVLVCDVTDGFAANADDCDDTNPAIHPDAEEVCDDRNEDEDCNGVADDRDDGVVSSSQTLWYADQDSDGYGDLSSAALRLCDAPSGTTAVAGDCDDQDPAINPGASEVCDAANRDEDCSGAADDDDASVDPSSFATFYRDTDRDGSGDDAFTQLACDAPLGYAPLGGDCDDNDPTRAPTLPEVCNNGIDEDCDEDPTDCRLSGDIDFADADAQVVHIDNDSYYGYDLTAADLNGDGIDDLISGAYDAEPTAGSENGQIYVNWGPITDDLTLHTDADITINGRAGGDNAGVINRTADLDGDGYVDIVIGAPDADEGGTNSGSVYLLSGPVSSWASTVSLATDYNQRWLGGTNSDRIGTDLSVSADVNGDGFVDLIVGGDGVDTPASSAGAVYVVFGPVSSTSSGKINAVADWTITGATASDALGDNRLIADAIDLDGDGIDDLALSSSVYDQPLNNNGALFLFYGSSGTLSASWSADDADAIFTGQADNDALGEGVEALGDVDGDGLADLAIGAYGYDGLAGSNTGAVHVLGGSTTRRTGTQTAISVAIASIEGGSSSDGIGECSAATDLDGDGFDDLVIGNDGDDTAATSSGLVAVFYGPVTGTWSTNDADARLLGPTITYSYMGRQLRTGDVNGDGLGDIIGIAYGNEMVGVYFGATW